MPTLNKNFTLTITVEQFLEACSLTELQEIDLLLNKYIVSKALIPHIKINQESFDEKWEASRNRFQERLEEKKKQYEKTLPESPRISKWNRAEYFCINRIKEMERSTGEPIPPDLKEIMMNVAKLESLKTQQIIKTIIL